MSVSEGGTGMFLSVRTRLHIICVAIAALSMAILSYTNFQDVKAHAYRGLNAELRQLADANAASIAEWVYGKKMIAGSMKLAVGQSDPLSFVKAAMVAGAFDDAYIGMPGAPGVFVHPMPPGYIAQKRPWYLEAQQAGAAVLTLPYVDATTQKMVVTFAEPIGPKGAARAVVGADVGLATLVRNVTSIKPTPSSFAFLIDRSGVIIAHPNQELVLKPVSDIDDDLSMPLILDLAQHNVSRAENIADRDELLVARKVDGTNWLLVICMDRREALAPLTAVWKRSALVTALVILIAGLLMIGAISGITRRGFLTPNFSQQ